MASSGYNHREKPAQIVPRPVGGGNRSETVMQSMGSGVDVMSPD
jgi:hypothetical protein